MLYREFYVQMSSFRNPNTFDRELNFGSTAVRRYSISVNANTLDKLLSRLTEEVHIPEQEEEILRAVSIVGRNTGIGGQPVWCLNRNLSVDRDGWATKSSDFGLEWVSHLTEPGNGGEIADESLAARVDGELTTAYFDAMTHLMAGSLEKKAAQDTNLVMVVSELFGHDQCLSFEEEVDEVAGEALCIADGNTTEDINPVPPETVRSLELQRDNFLSQFYLASMGVIMANYHEVGKCKKSLCKEISIHEQLECQQVTSFFKI